MGSGATPSGTLRSFSGIDCRFCRGGSALERDATAPARTFSIAICSDLIHESHAAASLATHTIVFTLLATSRRFSPARTHTHEGLLGAPAASRPQRARNAPCTTGSLRTWKDESMSILSWSFIFHPRPTELA
jgi:hypothetical protein